MLSHTRSRGDRGTVLLLFPAAVMIMVVMGALVIDTGVVHLRGRELQAVAQSAANDTLAALDVEALRRGEGIVIDADRARTIVGDAVAAGPLPGARLVAIDVGTDAAARLEIAVTMRLDTELVLAPALGDLDRVSLTRTGRAVILEE